MDKEGILAIVGEGDGVTWRQISSIREAIIDEMASPLVGCLGTHRKLFSRMSREVLPCPHQGHYREDSTLW